MSPGASDTWSNSTHRRRTIRRGNNGAWRICRSAQRQFTYHPAEPTRDQFNVITQLLGRADVTTVVNAADAGREGELIFDLVYTLARCRKPVERLWISSLTREAILAGFRHLQPAAAYRGLRDSARCRQQADWLVGLNATRAQTLRARQAGADGVYSLGRVQTPTLALIVARDQEIAAFVPVEYYEVVATFQASAGSYNGLWGNAQGSRLTTRAAADAITAKVQGRRGTVVKVEKQARRERPPLLYDLTSLQQAANARYAFSAAHTLTLAQSLYEKTFITYPRTASRHLSTQRQPGTAGPCRGRQRRPVSPLYSHDPGPGKRQPHIAPR